MFRPLIFIRGKHCTQFHWSKFVKLKVFFVVNNYIKIFFWNQFFSLNSSSATFFAQSDNRIGGKYIKARYVEYKDANFTTKKVRNESYLGIFGPIIKAEVGDEIHVVFKNKVRVSLWISLNIHTKPKYANRPQRTYFSDSQ